MKYIFLSVIVFTMIVSQECKIYTNKHGIQLKVVSEGTPTDHSDIVKGFANITHEKLDFFFSQFGHYDEDKQQTLLKIE